MRNNNRVAIIGRGKTNKYTPWDDPDVDLWLYNDFAMSARRVTAMFEMHNDALTADRYGDDYKAWLQEPHTFPIYMHQTDDCIPASHKFPKYAINALYSRGLFKGAFEEQNFYTSTTPYAIALAIWMRYKRIEFYGIDLAGITGEYAKYADCIFFWLGKASMLGIEIHIHEESPLLSGVKLYGI